MRFNIITIFPHIFDSYWKESILKRAQEKNLIEINVHDLRDWTKDKHKTVDDTPYGGGAGMVMKVEPIYDCVKSLESKLDNKLKSRVILFSAKGKIYNQKKTQELIQYDNLILICGRYEGVDERVAKYIVDEEISIGQYILTGGEIPAMILVDSITRLLPDVLGNSDSLNEESFNNRDISLNNNLREYPQYTKPQNFRGLKVPEVLLSGNHQKIKKWRKSNRKN